MKYGALPWVVALTDNTSWSEIKFAGGALEIYGKFPRGGVEFYGKFLGGVLEVHLKWGQYENRS